MDTARTQGPHERTLRTFFLAPSDMYSADSRLLLPLLMAEEEYAALASTPAGLAADKGFTGGTKASAWMASAAHTAKHAFGVAAICAVFVFTASVR